MTSSYPVFVDGAKIGEATRLSYTAKPPVEYKGTGLPGRTIVEQDPPEYLIEAEFPAEEIYTSIETDSHVEVAIPPTEHDGTGWRVLEVWMIHQFEITANEFSLAAYEGEIVDDVEYLGFDTDRVVEGEKLVEPKPGISLRIDTKHNSDEAGTVLNDSEVESDDGFSADMHDI